MNSKLWVGTYKRIITLTIGHLSKLVGSEVSTSNEVTSLTFISLADGFAVAIAVCSFRMIHNYANELVLRISSCSSDNELIMSETKTWLVDRSNFPCSKIFEFL